MDIHDIHREMQTKSIFDIPLRVTYYARVSTDSKEQKNSLSNQISYYENFIKQNQAWTFVPGYIDEGLSGISTKKRENFNLMIEDSTTGMFDLIITKEISRFARNTLDSIQYTRDLLRNGVGVLFQNDNINTLDEDSELRLTIMSGIAQDELRKLSSRVKFGHQQAIKKNVVLGNSRIFGYRKENKRLVIDDEEAAMVMELFKLYSTDNYSMKQIEKIFWEKGYRNHNGNKIAHSTMANIIANPKYKGYYVGNKVRVVDMFTKKQKFLPPEEWVMFKDDTGEIVPAIVSEAIWNKANEILRRRSEDVKNRQGISNHANIFTGKLYCTHCGLPYYRKESKDKLGNINSKWVCSGKINNGKDSCDSFPIFEDELKKLVFEVFKDIRPFSEEIVDEYIRIFEKANHEPNLIKQINAIETKLRVTTKKKSKLLELVTLDSITAKDFKQMSADCNKEIELLEKELLELKNKQNASAEFNKHINEIRAALREAGQNTNVASISKHFIDTFVDKIFITPVDKDTMQLDIKVFTGEVTEKYLKKLRKKATSRKNNDECDMTSDILTDIAKNNTDMGQASEKSRMGHMSKKMIEAYENGMK